MYLIFLIQNVLFQNIMKRPEVAATGFIYDLGQLVFRTASGKSELRSISISTNDTDDTIFEKIEDLDYVGMNGRAYVINKKKIQSAIDKISDQQHAWKDFIVLATPASATSTSLQSVQAVAPVAVPQTQQVIQLQALYREAVRQLDNVVVDPEVLRDMCGDEVTGVSAILDCYQRLTGEQGPAVLASSHTDEFDNAPRAREQVLEHPFLGENWYTCC